MRRRVAPFAGDRGALIEPASCSTLSYMKGMITVRLDGEVEQMLARVVKLSGRSQSDVVRDALRRQLAIDLFEQMRRRVAPFAEAQGLLTDEDVFTLVS
jgi:Arc/MetJ-type ribon-helix-helix transcriptional regulator